MVLDGDRGDALRQLERRLHGVGEPPPDVRVRHQAVDHDLDVVLVVAVQARLLREVDHLQVVARRLPQEHEHQVPRLLGRIAAQVGHGHVAPVQRPPQVAGGPQPA